MESVCQQKSLTTKDVMDTIMEVMTGEPSLVGKYRKAQSTYDELLKNIKVSTECSRGFKRYPEALFSMKQEDGIAFVFQRDDGRNFNSFLLTKYLGMAISQEMEKLMNLAEELCRSEVTQALLAARKEAGDFLEETEDK